MSSKNHAEYMDNSFGTMSNNDNSESPKNEELLKSMEKQVEERKAIITVNI